MKRHRRGMSLIELLMVVAILGVLGGLLVPLGATDQDAMRAESTAHLVTSDLEHTQMLALSRPSQRIGLAIDMDGRGWKIVDADAPSVPLFDAVDTTATPRSLHVRLGEGRALMSEQTLVAPRGQVIVYDPLGGLETPGGPASQMTISSGDASRTISIEADTGFISME